MFSWRKTKSESSMKWAAVVGISLACFSSLKATAKVQTPRICLNLAKLTQNLMKEPKLQTRKALTAVEHLEFLPPSARLEILADLKPELSARPSYFQTVTQDGCDSFSLNGLRFTIDLKASSENSVSGETIFSDKNGNTHHVQFIFTQISPHQLNFEIRGPHGFSVPGSENTALSPCTGYFQTTTSYTFTWDTDGKLPYAPPASKELLALAGATFNDINTSADTCSMPTDQSFKTLPLPTTYTGGRHTSSGEREATTGI